MTTGDSEVMIFPVTASPMCRVQPIDDAIHAHLSRRYWDWRTLYEQAPTASPMQHPDAVLVEARHASQHRCRPALAVAELNERCVAAAPLIPKVTRLRRLGGIGLNTRVSGLRLGGNDFLQREHHLETAAALMQAVLDHVVQSGASFLLIEDLDEQSLLAATLKAVLPPSWFIYRHAGMQPRRRIQLPNTPEAYWNTFSSKTRSTFRRKLKKFGETRLERITSVADVARFLDTAHSISLQTWQTRQFGLRIRNNAEEIELLTTLAQLGCLRSYLWFANQEPIAFTLGHQANGCFHYEEVGYAASYAKHSPGQMMLIQMIDDLLRHDRPEWFDFGGGDADYKQLFANHESCSGTVWLCPPTLANSAAVNYLRGCRRLRSAARQAIVTSGLANSARQWVRYGWNRLTRQTATAAVPTATADE